MSGTMGITRAEARRAVRANAERSARMAALAEQLVDALRAVLPYAESRLEDMEEDQERIEALNGTDRAYPAETVSESLAYLEKARTAFETARTALALANGGR